MKSESNDKEVGNIMVNINGEIGIVTEISTDSPVITRFEEGSGIIIPASPVSYGTFVTTGISALDESVNYCIQPDVDTLLRNAVRDHNADRSISIDCGTAYFCDNGSLVVECSFPSNNMFHMLIDGDDPVNVCDKAMSVLEDIKSMVSKMQEKVFELSLSQRAKDD
jgi:hypothetical protein